VKDLQVSNTILNSDHSYLLLEVEMTKTDPAARNSIPSNAGTQRFKLDVLDEGKREAYMAIKH
jgi:hypothetical protein